jgi:hypothetical protein
MVVIVGRAHHSESIAQAAVGAGARLTNTPSLLALSAGAIPGWMRGEGPARGRIAWARCPLRVPKIDEKCGKFEVFENREARAGRKISLNLVVVPATSANPFPDPVFFFGGGPVREQ